MIGESKRPSSLKAPMRLPVKWPVGQQWAGRMGTISKKSLFSVLFCLKFIHFPAALPACHQTAHPVCTTL
jgi:hypothetical protein